MVWSFLVSNEVFFRIAKVIQLAQKLKKGSMNIRVKKTGAGPVFVFSKNLC